MLLPKLRRKKKNAETNPKEANANGTKSNFNDTNNTSRRSKSMILPHKPFLTYNTKGKEEEDSIHLSNQDQSDEKQIDSTKPKGEQKIFNRYSIPIQDRKDEIENPNQLPQQIQI